MVLEPYFSAWSWLPGTGYFYSPFGFPFYSPEYVILRAAADFTAASIGNKTTQAEACVTMT